MMRVVKGKVVYESGDKVRVNLGSALKPEWVEAEVFEETKEPPRLRELLLAETSKTGVRVDKEAPIYPNAELDVGEGIIQPTRSAKEAK